MALNFASMLLQPTQVRPWDLSPDGSSNARAQLKLAREQFEYEKQHHKEQAELERAKLNAEAQRQEALREKERLDREAQQQAALLEKQQGAMAEAVKLGGAGKAEQLSAMAPYFDQLGIDQNELGRVGGLPVFQFQNRAQEAARAQAEEAAAAGGDEMAGLGYPTNERGVMEPPAGIASTEDAFARAQAASEYSRLTGKPAAGPDEEDFTGAVPKNVIDMPAEHEATLARLNPMLAAVQRSYPTDYQSSAGDTGEAVKLSGLPVTESLDLFKSLRQSPDELIKAGIQADAQKQQFREKRDMPTPQDISVWGERGRKSAETLAKNNLVPQAVEGLDAADQVLDLLEDKSGANDSMVGSALLKMGGVKGDPSDRELQSAMGAEKISTMDELFKWIQEKSHTGFSDIQRDAIESYVKRTQERLTGKVYQFLDDSQKVGASYNEYEKAGFRERADMLVPFAYRKQWEEDRAKQKGGKKSAEMSGSGKTSSTDDKFNPDPISGDFDIELEGLALENDLDPDKIKPIVGHESGGKAGAISSEGASGVLQIMPDNLRAMGIDPEKYRKLSAVEQLPAVMQFLKQQGLTSDSSAEDYAMAVAASDPKFRDKNATDDMVVYPKGSPGWKANKPWRPADDGDITRGSILSFYGLRGGGTGKSAEAPKAELPEPSTPYEKRLKELMERSRR